MNYIGPYELRGELGRGAMAVVWRGYDANLGREVAVKEPVIPHGTAPDVAEELASRFIREGHAAAALSHPGIVTVFAADVYNGRPAIIMELIEGETLATILGRGVLSLAAATSIADQLLDALGYAHARGVVHRDIKPDNVFVTDDGRVKLTDFGIAHVGTGTALTQAGTVMGTPGYMAPEQVRGEAVDARADLFGVGVMLHEMLTGQNPFTAGDAHPTTIMYRVLNEPLPDVHATLPDAPESLSATVAVATAKYAEQRFSSADEMRGALRGDVVVGAAFMDATNSSQRKAVNIVLGLTVAAMAILVLLILPDRHNAGVGQGGGGVPSNEVFQSSASEPSDEEPPIDYAEPQAPQSTSGGIPPGHPDIGGPDDSSTSPASQSDQSAQDYVARYYELCQAGAYHDAFRMLPARTQDNYGNAASFEATLRGYGITEYGVDLPQKQGGEITVRGWQVAQGMTFGYLWTFEQDASGNLICVSREMDG